MPIKEGDEQIYKALTEYVLAGQPYSMATHPLVTEGELPVSLYGAPVFFHPPAGIYFFALFAKFLHLWGLKFAQLACFAIFFWSMLGTAYRLFPKMCAPVASLLLVFTPIYAQISLRVWIDNPKVAFFSLHFFLVLLAVKNRRYWWLAAPTALLMVLTKVDSLAALPFAYGIAWMESGKKAHRELLGLTALCLIAALAWSVHANTLFHAPSLPTDESKAKSYYAYMVTEGTTPLEFVVQFFKVITTFLPALFFMRKRDPLGLILFAWVLGILLFYTGLGVFGYAKLLRYLCIGVPGTVLFFIYAMERAKELPRTPKAYALVGFLALGMLLEIGQGINILVFKPHIALVETIF